METISVKNFRSIQDSKEVKLCPLTVLVGKNSAGKSSFIRLLPLLKQTLERKISDTLLWYGDYVDFGDYQNTVSKQRKNDAIEIGFSIYINPPYRSAAQKQPESRILVYVTLVIREKYVEKVGLKLFDQSIELQITNDGKTEILINGDKRPFEKISLHAQRETGSIIPAIYKTEKNREWPFPTYVNLKEIVEYCNNYISPNIKTESLADYSHFSAKLNIPISSQAEILKTLKELNRPKFENFKLDHKRFQKINNHIIATQVFSTIESVNRAVMLALKQTSYLKPIRAMVDRYYRVQGISIDELDADGSNLPMILKNMTSSQLKSFEKWSKDKFGIVFSVTHGEGHISLVIKDDVGGNTESNVADTGYGYSQMLPIVMLLWMIHKDKSSFFRYNQRTVVIEQPELHLHPAYQAKMIDVFVNIINEAKNNNINVRIILETHSETIINRIGTLIEDEQLQHDDVNILLFEKTNGQTTVQSKKYDCDGLLEEWPVGFFSVEEA